VAAGTRKFRQGSRSVFEIVVDDGSARLHCRWWNLPFMERVMAVGDRLVIHGKPRSLRPRTIDHPETEKLESGDDATLHVGRIVPVHPLTEGLTPRVLRTLVWRALEQLGPAVPEPEPRLVPIDGPGAWLTRAEALRALHFPDSPEQAERARKRLALDEFLPLQLAIQRRRLNFEQQAKALPCAGDNRLMRPFLNSLGFRLTGAQTRVLREIRQDLGGAVPMRRLLQGDVGSGKTVVAAGAAVMALESGYNVALMAPTEILAGQLHRHFARWLEPLGIQVWLRTGSRRSEDTLFASAPPGGPPPPCPGGSDPGPARGVSPLVVGTHALISDGFLLDRLGLVIIDEQHRFGVAQREQLVRKGRHPHLLVMTATPIPRTLGLTLYGDLDVSVIDQRPSGRGRIRTHVRRPDALPKVWSFIREQLAVGRQAYVVYPRIDESEHDDVKAAEREYPRIQEALAPHRVALLHGQVPPEAREALMKDFRSNGVQALVATSVIEVGVDVPNATVMLVEDAGQFGLSQLHQLRGRIGRGSADAHCILVAGEGTEAAQERLEVLARTDDGFAIAEADLRLRGPGELLGRHQSGLPDFRFGHLLHDRELVELARDLARRHLRSEPGK
ncbi:MAG: ATP-dependent DNA helicase RecG, partial [Verrucomicrobiota bacterium]